MNNLKKFFRVIETITLYFVGLCFIIGILSTRYVRVPVCIVVLSLWILCPLGTLPSDIIASAYITIKEKGLSFPKIKKKKTPSTCDQMARNNNRAYFSISKMVIALYPSATGWDYCTDNFGALINQHKPIPIVIKGKEISYKKDIILNSDFTVKEIIEPPKKKPQTAEEVFEQMAANNKKAHFHISKLVIALYPSATGWDYCTDNFGALINQHKPIPIVINGKETSYKKIITLNSDFTIKSIKAAKETTEQTDTEQFECEARVFLSSFFGTLLRLEDAARAKGDDTYIITNDLLPIVPEVKQQICNLLKLKEGYTTAEVVDDGLLLEVKSR